MPRTVKPLRLADLAAFLGTEVEGDGALILGGFASLGTARADELVFVRDAAHLEGLATSPALAAIAPPGLSVGERSVLRSSTPAHDFSRAMLEFAPVHRPAAGIAPGALVDETASVDPSAAIEAGARIGPLCRVGPRSIVFANATLVAEVEIGSDCLIHSGVVLREDTQLGDRVVLQPGVVIGGDGFGLVPDASGRPTAMAHRGRVILEDDVEIGANSTVDRATLDETRIRCGAKIDNLVQIAHNCDIGENAIIVAQTGLSGGTIVGRGAVIMAQAGSAGHLRVGEGAFIGARAGLNHDVPDGARVFGSPAQPERGWHKTVAALKKLPELIRRVRRLERALEDHGGDEGRDRGDSDSD